MTRPLDFLILISLALLQAGAASADPPAGYYDPAEGLTGNALQAALHNIIDGHDPVSYEYLWTAFYTTDDKPNGKVWDMYSDIPGGTPPYEYTFGVHQGGSASGEGEGYNREHTWPRSWFGGSVSPMNTDLFQVVPTDIYVNNRRGNEPYAEVSNPTWTSLNGSRLGPSVTPGYSGTAFEPRDEYKGDLARNYFYMSTRYYGEDGGWPSDFPMTDGAELEGWAVDMLLQWHTDDPVSDKELDRNETVYAIQDNRNPFIDHPEFAYLLWDPTGIEEEGPLVMVAMTGAPNPFSSVTTVSFSMTSPTPVTLRVFDVTGRTVSVLMDGQTLPAGHHETSWDGTGGGGALLAPGVYFCRLDAGSESSVLRMLLVR